MDTLDYDVVAAVTEQVSFDPSNDGKVVKSCYRIKMTNFVVGMENAYNFAHYHGEIVAGAIEQYNGYQWRTLERIMVVMGHKFRTVGMPITVTI